MPLRELRLRARVSQAIEYVADQLIAARNLGVEEAVVVGGGNFFRGNVAEDWGIERAEADNIGMLGTVMNGILLRGVLKHRGLEDVRLMTALPMHSMAEPFIRLKALSHLERDQLVLLACRYRPALRHHRLSRGAARHRVACRRDPAGQARHRRHLRPRPAQGPERAPLRQLGYSDVLERDLRVMDQQAIVLARDYGLPLHVFDFDERDAISAICQGENRGTYISPSTKLVKSAVAPVS